MFESAAINRYLLETYGATTTQAGGGKRRAGAVKTKGAHTRPAARRAIGRSRRV
jgi:hypothetical protein